MAGEYLSTGFRDVDGARNRDAYFNCLTLLDSLPYYRQYKTRSYALLELQPGLTVRDAGCGLGDDVFRIAELIVPDGKVVGLDASAAMIDRARSCDLSSRWPVEFQTGDINALPFAENTFERCRVDRVLQHVCKAQQAIGELVRILKPNGILLAYDNDWATFRIASEEIETTRAIERCWCNSFANSRIGRDLPAFFLNEGLSNITTYPGTSVITDFEMAEKVYNLRDTVRKAVAQNLMSTSQGSDWIDEQTERTAKGCFKAVLTAYTVVGRKRQV